jgi:hypothetical protein
MISMMQGGHIVFAVVIVAMAFYRLRVTYACRERRSFMPQAGRETKDE